MKLFNNLSCATLLVASLAACSGSATKETSSDSTMTDAMGTEMTTTETSSTTTTVVPGTYTNLSTGKKVYIIRNPETGYAYDSIAKVPVEFYINDQNDTLYWTGEVVNNALMRTGDGKWKLDDSKMKVDGDEVKVKTDSSKLKIDGDEMKEKTPTTKSKTEGGVTTTKPRN